MAHSRGRERAVSTPVNGALPRDVRDMLSRHGVTIEALRVRKHVFMRCRTRCGKAFTLTVSRSHSDVRALRNIESVIKSNAQK